MTVTNVTNIPVGPKSASVPGFSLPLGDDFSDKLQLGQIIKGRVLRHYGEQRYAVDFGGRERVVDSAVPLKSGETLYGKVVGLGDQVELQRVRGGAPTAVPESQNSSIGIFRGGHDDISKIIADLFTGHQTRLTLKESAIIENAVRSAGNPRLMAMSALLVNKLGITIATEWLKIMYQVLSNEPGQGTFPLSGKSIELQTSFGQAGDSEDSASDPLISELATMLRELVEEMPARQEFKEASEEAASKNPATLSEEAGLSDDPDQSSGQGQDFARLLLNVQTGGSVNHRVNTIPLLVNGRLLELNIAMFEQREQQQESKGTKHRQLSFSLNTEGLGHVEANLYLTGSHIKMKIASDLPEAADKLAGYSEELAVQIKSEGWLIDEMSYEVSRPEGGGVARTVLQHVISQDSLSRLV